MKSDEGRVKREELRDEFKTTVCFSLGIPLVTLDLKRGERVFGHGRDLYFRRGRDRLRPQDIGGIESFHERKTIEQNFEEVVMRQTATSSDRAPVDGSCRLCGRRRDKKGGRLYGGRDHGQEPADNGQE